MIAPSLQQDFIDKDTGELLAYGVVTFYSDNDHTQLKPVYTVSGPPDDPIFTELPNPLILSGIGTFIDPNNDQDIIPYYRPYDDDGNVELYYITVYSADDVLQFTRDHYPTVNVSSETTILQVENFLPNGQFLMHLDLPDDGQIDQSVGFVDIAYGGWLYSQNPGTSSINYVTFPRYDAPIDDPVNNPRYAVRLLCTFANPSDSLKDINNVITDVNFMQNQALTFQVTAYSNDGNNHNVQLVVAKSYGTGGSPPTQEVIATLTVTPEIQDFLVNFTMSDNTGKTLGPDDDDHVNIILRSPLPSTSDITYTDIMMVQGTFAQLIYPPVTPEQDKAFTLPASFDIPAYDGSDSGKFVMLGTSTQNATELAYVYQNAVPTGTIILSAIYTTTPPTGYLYCDGGDVGLDRSDPRYINLYNTIGWAFGTGINGFDNSLTPPASNQFYVIYNRYDVDQANPNPGTSGFTFSVDQVTSPGSQPQIILWTVLPGSSITAGSYYTQPVNTTGPQFVQLFWFTVDGTGTIPNVAHDVALEIAILSTDTAQQVRDKLINQANGLFAIPDMRGFFPRIWDNGAGRDDSANSRNPGGGPFPAFPYLVATGFPGDNVGSWQNYQNSPHDHPDIVTNPGVTNPDVYIKSVNNAIGPDRVQVGTDASFYAVAQSLYPDPIYGVNTDSIQTRPINVYVNAFIKT
jgi:hypothetical protein